MTRRSAPKDWSNGTAATPTCKGWSLTVNTGEVHGFLRPNGAGKTTTIRTPLGPLRPTAGRTRLRAATPGATPPGCTGGWPMYPATSPCGPT